MQFTRAQITAALTALDLDPDLTTTVVVNPHSVYTEIAVLTNGHPTVENGALQTIRETSPISEEEVATDAGS